MGMMLQQEQEISRYLETSPLLDYKDPIISELITRNGWHSITKQTDLVNAVYSFVRDDIEYGHTESYAVQASRVLALRCGNCLTKTTLLMALLRAVGIPCRFHAMTISKVIFRGLLQGASYRIARNQSYHAWVEIQFKGKWLALEGHIIDKSYLLKLQQRFPDYMGSFYGFGIAVLNFKNPENRWRESHTYVQNKAIEQDIGTFDTPDEFFSEYPEAESYTQSFRYKAIIRGRLNNSIIAMRGGK